MINDKLYVASGCCVDSTTTRFNNLQVYDPATNAWTMAAPIPLAVYFAPTGMMVINGNLYVAGGQADPSQGSNVSTLQIYNSATDSWTTGAPLPAAGGAAFGGVIGGKLYVASGQDPSNEFAVNTVTVYDPTTNTWSPLAPIPTPRSGGGSAVIDGILYTVGGSNDSSTVLGMLEAYDPTSNTWTQLAPMPTARFLLRAAAVNGILYAVGGNDRTNVLDVVETYNPATNTWNTITPMPVATQLPGVEAINGVLYVAGGDNQASQSQNVLQVFTPAIGPPTEKDQCKNDDWQAFNSPRRFKNQGDCVSFVETGK